MKFKIGTLFLVAMFFVSSASAECSSCNITKACEKITKALASAKNSTVDFLKRNHNDHPYYLYGGAVVVATAVGALAWYLWQNQDKLRRGLRGTFKRSFARAKRATRSVTDAITG